MLSFRFNHVRIESYALNLPPYEVTSQEIEDKLAPLYEKLKIPFGTLEKLSGIKSRYFFDKDDAPSKVATVAAEEAISNIGFEREHLKALFTPEIILSLPPPHLFTAIWDFPKSVCPWIFQTPVWVFPME